MMEVFFVGVKRIKVNEMDVFQVKVIADSCEDAKDKDRNNNYSEDQVEDIETIIHDKPQQETVEIIGCKEIVE